MEIYLYLFIGALAYLLGAIVFGRFEVFTPLPKRFRKLVFYFGGLLLTYAAFGGAGALVWVVVLMGIGLVFHFWWCNKNEIHPLKAEPRERYYELRGWAR